MKTYNDLLECGENEAKRIAFIEEAIAHHESSEMFAVGRDAGFFYRHIDPDLEVIQKVFYDGEGNPHADEVSSNHKLTSNFFYLFITQMVAYMLGNGVSFDNEEVKKQLGGSDFDYKMQRLLAYAAVDGESYGLVTESGIVPFCYACKLHGDEPYLVPLKDEDDGKIKAAIRYWRLAPDKPLRVTLYELDGFTEYKEDSDGILVVLKPKDYYRKTSVSNDIQGDYDVKGQNYVEFPIVPLGFINGQSSLIGNRQTLFAYDVVMSGMVNNIDMNTVYWTIKNANGMDDYDNNRFILNLLKSHVLHTDDASEVIPHELSMKHEAHEAVLTQLRKQLFFDFQAVDVERIASGNITTVEIKAAYQNLNLKCDEIEKYLSDFIRGVLRVKGIDENEPFHFKRPNDINTAEFVTMLVQIAPILGDDTTLKLICETLGLIDEYEQIKAHRDAESMMRFNASMQGEEETAETEENENG